MIRPFLFLPMLIGVSHWGIFLHEEPSYSFRINWAPYGADLIGYLICDFGETPIYCW